MLDTYSHVPEEIVLGAIQATEVLDSEARRGKVLVIPGYEASEEELDAAFHEGVSLVRREGQTGQGTFYHLDPLQPRGAWVHMHGRGRPFGPASLSIETQPVTIGNVPREFTVVEMSGSMSGDRVATLDPDTLTVNELPARPIVRKSVIQLVNFAKAALEPRG